MRYLVISTALAGALFSGIALAQTGGASGSGSSSSSSMGGSSPSASPGSTPSRPTMPIPAPGTEGSSKGRAAPGSTGSVGTGGQSVGEPSAVGTTAREQELNRRNEAIDRRIRRGICTGC